VTLPELLEALNARGVHLELRLRVVSPAGPLPPELLDALTEHKTRLLVTLGRRLQWGELSTQRWANQDADPTPDIDIIGPNRERQPEALEATHRNP
jgi:hypothetical protein